MFNINLPHLKESHNLFERGKIYYLLSNYKLYYIISPCKVLLYLYIVEVVAFSILDLYSNDKPQNFLSGFIFDDDETVYIKMIFFCQLKSAQHLITTSIGAYPDCRGAELREVNPCRSFIKNVMVRNCQTK